MRAEIAIVENVEAELRAEFRATFSALREADVQEAKAGKRADDAQRIAARAKETAARLRLETGRVLLKMRKLWPARGPNAKGWGEFLASEGIDDATARRYMELAEHVGDISLNGVEPERKVPSYAEVRATKRGLLEEAADGAAEDPGAVEIISPGAAIDIRHGRWQDVLSDVGVVDLVCTDAPYDDDTHGAVTTRDDGCIPTGLTPTYDAWAPDDVADFVAYWSSSDRCRGWICGITSDVLIPAWRAAARRHDRYDFAPVPCVIRGMSVRIQGDGPSSWAVYLMVSRPRHLAKWGTLPGAYEGPAQPGAKSGRGKPDWLMDAIVGDYSRAGDLVCDPLAGYGTTLRSALRLGRRAVGAEIDPDARREAIVRWRADQQNRTEAIGG